MKLRLLLLATFSWTACGGLPDPGPVLRSEHPRPQLQRAEWLNLNGVWGFRFDASDEGLAENWPADPPRFSDPIRVPFPWQELGEPEGVVGWYRRTFNVPADWAGRRTWLRIEGVAGEARVWVGGAEAGVVASGFDGAEFDITDQASPGAESEILIRVEAAADVTSSGITGTVWLEARPETYLSAVDFKTVREGDEWLLEAYVEVRGPGAADVVIESSDTSITKGGASVALAGGTDQAVVRLPVADPQLWSPDSPHLYPLTIRVAAVGDAMDVVETSAALRTLAADGRHILVNGAPEYFRGVVRSPRFAESDDDLRLEVERLKSLGFNLLDVPTGAELRLRDWARRLGLWTLDELQADIEIEVSETGSDQGEQPLLIAIGPQTAPALPQLFRDFTNRVRRLDFAQGYIWGAEIPTDFGYDALAAGMTAADLQAPDYIGLDGAASLETVPGAELPIAPFVSRYSPADEPLQMQVWLRGVNDLGGEVEFFSRPRQVNVEPGQTAALEEIEMSVPLLRSLSGVVGFELLDDSVRRRAVNYAPLVVRAFSTDRSPRAERFAPRRTALRAAPGEGQEIRDSIESVEYIYPVAPGELAAIPTEIEVLIELGAYPGNEASTVRAVLNGRPVGELNLPNGPSGPAGFLAGSDSRYGHLVKLRLGLGAEDLAVLRQSQAFSLRLEPVTRGFTVFGEKSGRYVIDPTIILVTENVP